MTLKKTFIFAGIECDKNRLLPLSSVTLGLKTGHRAPYKYTEYSWKCMIQMSKALVHDRA